MWQRSGQQEVDSFLAPALGPATANARLPIVDRLVAGMTRLVDDADRRRRQAVLPTGVASSVKYHGAAPLMQRYMSTDSLYWMRTSSTHRYIS